jgi:signal transduction histidine kinase
VTVLADKAALDALPPGGDEVMLVDVRMAGTDPRGFVTRLRDRRPGADVLVSTGFMTMEQAVAALRAGAFDLVQKPPVWERLGRTLDIVLERRTLASRSSAPRRAAPERRTDDAPLALYENLIGLVPGFGFLRLLLSGGLGELTQDQKDAVHNVQESLDWLKRRIKSQLQAAASDPAATAVKPEVVEITALVEHAVEMLRPMAYESGVEITLHAGAATTIFVDRDRLLLIIFSLLLNAIEASRAGGEVAVEVREEPSAVTVLVADNGIGIPEEHQGQIFERFYRIEGDDRPHTEGLGLGLSSAHVNAVLLESELAFASTPGQGSTFSLTLPRAPARGG